MSRATFCWECLGKCDSSRARTAAMAPARAPAPRMVLVMRFHHRRAGLSGGLARRAEMLKALQGLEVRPERRPLRLLITASQGARAGPFAGSDDTAQVVVQRWQLAGSGRSRKWATRTSRTRLPRPPPPGFLMGCDFAVLFERRPIRPAPRSPAPSRGRSRHASSSTPGC